MQSVLTAAGHAALLPFLQSPEGLPGRAAVLLELRKLRLWAVQVGYSCLDACLHYSYCCLRRWQQLACSHLGNSTSGCTGCAALS